MQLEGIYKLNCIHLKGLFFLTGLFNIITTITALETELYAVALERQAVAFQCNKDGFFRDPYNCTIFYRCADLTGDSKRFQLFKFDCPPGTVYDEKMNICDHPRADLPCGTVEEDDKDTSQHHSPHKPKPIYVKPIFIVPMPVPGSKPNPIPVETGSTGTTIAKPVSPTVPTSIANKRCSQPGLFRSPEDCRRFYICVDVYGNGSLFQLCEYPCPDGTVFSNKLSICTEPKNAEPCKDIAATTSRPINPPTQPDIKPTIATLIPKPTLPATKPTAFSTKPTGTPGPSPTATSSKPTMPPTIPTVPQTKPTAPPTKPSVPSPKPTNPPIVPSGFRCSATGYFPHPTNCSHYYQCVNLTDDGRAYQRYEFICGEGTVFDASVGVCNHLSVVSGCGGTQITVKPSTPPTSVKPPITQPAVKPTPLTIKPTLKPVTPPSVRPTIPPRPPIGTPVPPSPGHLTCSYEGFFRHPTNCSRFYQCVNVSTELRPHWFITHEYACGPGTAFDETVSVCNHPSAVPGCEWIIIQPPRPTSRPTSPSVTQPAVKPTILTAKPTSPTVTRPPIRPPIGTPVPPGPGRLPCNQEGFFRHPTNCSRFYQCVNVSTDVRPNAFISHEYACGPGTAFDETVNVCNHPSAVPGCEWIIIQPPKPTSRPISPVTQPAVKPTILTAKPTSPTVTRPPIRPPIGTPVPPGPGRLPCNQEGFFRHPTNCSRFYQCVNVSTELRPSAFISHEYTCGPGTAFDETVNVCNHPSAVPGCEWLTIQPPKPTSRPISPVTQPAVKPTILTAKPTSPTVTRPPIRPPIGTPVPPGPGRLPCNQEGFFRHPTNCSRFYQCVNVSTDVRPNAFISHEYACGPGTAFDETVNVCNHPSAVPGCEWIIVQPPKPTSLPIFPPVTQPAIKPTILTAKPTLPTVTRPPIRPPIGTPVPPGPGRLPCNQEGFFRHPTNCSRFYQCVNVSTDVRPNAFISHEYACGPGTAFDETVNVCNHPSAVPGCEWLTIQPPKPTSRPISPVTQPAVKPTILTAKPTSPTVTRPPIRPPIGTPVPPGPGRLPCNQEGFFRHPTNCSRFYQCVNVSTDVRPNALISHEYACGPGTAFDETVNVCNHPSAVPGCEWLTIQPPKPTSRPISPVTQPAVKPTILTAKPTLPTVTRPPIRPPIGTPVPPGPGRLPCNQEGFFRHPSNCSRFYQCVNVSTELRPNAFISHEYACGPGTAFDESVNVCNHPSAVPGCEWIIVQPPKPTSRPISPVTQPAVKPTILTAKPTSPTFTRPPIRPPIGTPVPPGPGRLPCNQEGFFRHPTNCSRFYQCVNVSTELRPHVFISHEFACGPGTSFDETVNVCNHPSAVPGCEWLTIQPPKPTSRPISPVTQPAVKPTILTAKPTSPTVTRPPIRPPIGTPLPPGPGRLPCNQEGFFRHPTNCSRFYQCVNVSTELRPHVFISHEYACGPGTAFDETVNVCNHPAAVPGCEWIIVQPSVVPPVVTPVLPPITPTAKPPTGIPVPPSPHFLPCAQEGYFKHPYNCSRFYQCINISSNTIPKFLRHEFACASGTVFDDAIGVCNHPSLVPGCERVIVLPPTHPEPHVTKPSIKPTSSPTLSPIPTISPTRPIIPIPPSPWPPCTGNGFFRNPNNCSHFYRCINLTNDGDAFQRHDFMCGENTVFDITINICNHISNVPECLHPVTSVTFSPETSSTRPILTPKPIPPTVSGNQGASTSTVITVTPPTIGPIPVLPVSPGGEVNVKCVKDGFIRSPTDCAKFYRCVYINHSKSFIRLDFVCGSGTVFDEAIGICNSPSVVPGCESYVGTTVPCPHTTKGTSATISTIKTTPWQPKPTIGTKPTISISPVTMPSVLHTLASTVRLPVTPSSTSTCTAEGYFTVPEDCSQFYRCVDVTGKGIRFQKVVFQCPAGTGFDESISACNHQNVAACSSTSTSTSTKHPLVTISSSTPITTVAPTTTTTAVPGPFQCTATGKFAHRSDCSKFYLCQDLFGNSGQFHICEVQCPVFTYFDESLGYCSENVHPHACLHYSFHKVIPPLVYGF